MPINFLPKPTIETAHVFRFWAKVVKSGECWLFTEGGGGYGHFRIGPKVYVASRAVFWILGLEIPEGMGALHRCPQKNCIRPSHLYPGTESQNQQDSLADGTNFQRAKTHCPQGHPYSGDNVRYSNRGRVRVCKTCKRRQWREWKARKAQVELARALCR